MARAVEWADRARSDLRLAVEYIRKDSPGSAKAFLSQVFQASQSLSTFSERGRVFRTSTIPRSDRFSSADIGCCTKCTRMWCGS